MAPPESDSVSQATVTRAEEAGGGGDGGMGGAANMSLEQVEYLMSMGIEVAADVVRAVRSVANNDSWTEPTAPHSRIGVVHGTAMTIEYKILVAKKQVQVAQGVVERTFADVDEHLNNWSAQSHVSKLNRAPPGEAHKASPMLLSVAGLALQLHRESNGRFDPTCGAVWSGWRAALRAGAEPSAEEAAKLATCVGLETHFSITPEAVSRKTGRGTLDLGGIAKGYAIDLLVARLSAAGIADAYVDWGSDIRAIGRHPDGRPWRTCIAEPPKVKDLFKLWKSKRKVDPEKLLDTVDMHNTAMATSGDYMQTEKFGFHHIVDPSSKTPLRTSDTGISSVSVLALTASLADAVATAAMTFATPEEARDWIVGLQTRAHAVLGYWIYARKGNKLLKGTRPRMPMGSLAPFARPIPLKTLIPTWTVPAMALGTADRIVMATAVHSCSLTPPLVSILCPPSTELSADKNRDFAISVLRDGQEPVRAAIAAGSAHSAVAPHAVSQLRTVTGAMAIMHGQVVSVHAISSALQLVLGKVVEVELASVRSQAPPPPLVHAPLAPATAMRLPVSRPSSARSISYERAESSSTLAGLLRLTMRHVPRPVVVIGAVAVDGTKSEPRGMTATSFAFCSLDEAQPLVYLNIQRAATLHGILCADDGEQATFTAHVLGKGQERLASSFAATNMTSAEQFAGVAISYQWRFGTPLMPDALCSLHCAVEQVVPSGDHSIVLARVLDFVDLAAGGSCLSYHDHNFVAIGPAAAGAGAPARAAVPVIRP